MTTAPADQGLALVEQIAARLNAGGGGSGTLAGVAELLRAGVAAARVAIWARDVSQEGWRCVSAPPSIGGEMVAAALPPPAEGTVTVPLVHSGRTVGLLVAETGPPGAATCRVVAELLAPFVALGELSAELAAELAHRARELEAQRRLTGLIIDSLPVGLYVVDRAYRVLVWNRRRELGRQGVPRGEAIGRAVFEVLGGQPRAELQAQLDQVFATGEILQLEQDVPGPDGARTYRISKIPMRLEGDAVTHVITIGEDVTEWRSIQGQIMQSEKLAAIGQLAAGVMHEINNPLATIGACVAAIDGRLRGTTAEHDRQLTEYLDIIEKEVERCSRIVDGLLDFSRPKGHAKAPVDVNRVVDDTLFLLKHHQRFRRITLERELAPALPPVLGNAEQLVQALMALLLNALDAMEQGGRLTVRTALRSARHDEVMVEVEDTGVGIPRAELTKIFEPFFTTKPPGRGTGLGLSICYGIIEDHRGRMEADSQVGRGSVFRVYLPVGDAPGGSR